MKLHYDDAEMEPAGVPAIIAYRGGDKFAGLVPLMAELPDDAELDATTVESVLKRCVQSRLFGVDCRFAEASANFHAIRHQILH